MHVHPFSAERQSSPVIRDKLTPIRKRLKSAGVAEIFRCSARSCRCFDKVIGFPYNRCVLERLQAHLEQTLLERQLPCGGWSFYPFSSQAALEPSALALLALSSSETDAVTRARMFLLSTQNSNGSWPAFVGDDGDGAWVTSLVLLALQPFFESTPQRIKGLSWLLQSAGREGNWFWKWKFRTADRHVKFDPDKYGWPWMSGTNSWAVPTAFAIIALRQSPCSRGLEDIGPRLRLGREMLLDRACPDGGWNAGNGVVYGSPMAPHPDATAIALLAFVDAMESSILHTSVRWLENVIPSLCSPWSLAWATITLNAHQRPLDHCVEQFHKLRLRAEEIDNATLAVAHMACSALDGWKPFRNTS